MTSTRSDLWASGTAYDGYMGRWSRLVAPEFLTWLAVPAGLRWLDVGSGTGILTSAILATGDPRSIVGVDPSEPFVEHARASVVDPRATFRVGTASETGAADESVDVVVSGLVLTLVGDVAAALAEARRVVVPGGLVAGYVWDYAEGMQLQRALWDAAQALDPAAVAGDEGRRFSSIAAPDPLRAAFAGAGLEDVEVRPIVVPTIFSDFDDYWRPFLNGTGVAPAYVASLEPAARDALRERLRSTLPTEADGSIRLTTRAWAVRGRRPPG